MKQIVFLIIVNICPVVLLGQTFSYPMPPDSILDRQRRVAYMAEHFWNEQSISDTLNFQNPRLLLDYQYLLKQLDEKQAEAYANSFIELACRKKHTLGQIIYWLDNILYDSSSPQYNERIYMLLMNAVLCSDADSVMKMTPAARVKMMKKNAIGKAANNFSFIDKKEQVHCLYDINTPLLLLIFNNPDCSLCHSTEEKIENNAHIQNMVKDEVLKILAITPNSEIADWEEHQYPENWITGFDQNKEIYQKQLYDIQRLPSIYLLDKDKQVLLKEANYDRLCQYLQENAHITKREDSY